MGSVLATETRAGGGGIGVPDDPRYFGGGGGGEDNAPGIDTAQVGLWVLLGSLTMLFAAFTSAYLVRRTGSDWVRIGIPSLLWVNTGVLIASSVSMEWARRAFRSLKPIACRRWTLVTFLLGSLFLVGQFSAWRQLAQAGIFLHSNPHSSFFYVLTGVHAAHIVAGIAVLLYVLVQAWRKALIPGESASPGLCATYWHFVGVAWIYLFAVLFLV